MRKLLLFFVMSLSFAAFAKAETKSTVTTNSVHDSVYQNRQFFIWQRILERHH